MDCSPDKECYFDDLEGRRIDMSKTITQVLRMTTDALKFDDHVLVKYNLFNWDFDHKVGEVRIPLGSYASKVQDIAVGWMDQYQPPISGFSGSENGVDYSVSSNNGYDNLCRWEGTVVGDELVFSLIEEDGTVCTFENRPKSVSPLGWGSLMELSFVINAPKASCFTTGRIMLKSFEPLVVDEEMQASPLARDTKIDGQYILMNAAIPSAQNGDLNDDSKINILDAVVMINLIVTDTFDCSADLNVDNDVSVLDIVVLINNILKST